MQHKRRVTCLKCKKFDVITFVETPNQHVVVDYEGKFLTPFRSFRWRPDLRWGFECVCGADDRLAPEEAKDIDKLVQGDAIGIANVVKNLQDPKPKFKMVGV